MTCTNARCSIWVICQNKGKPCPASGLGAVVRNGYAAMAMTEYKLRDGAINFKGGWDA